MAASESAKKKTGKKAAKKTGKDAAEMDGGKGNGTPDAAPKPLHELILNKRTGKYECIDRMSFWAKQLRKKEENRHLTQTEILELSISEVLSGKVDGAELDKLMRGEATKVKKPAPADDEQT
ncbi:MAG: hypothetical protein ABIJ96_07305 [Elusimicrobiota bacterium]